MSDKKIPLNKSVTSKDVAKEAGVSQSTVSRVFNSPEGCNVKPHVKERVLQIAKELGYRPNLVARGMISGRTNIVGLVVGDSLGPFYNTIINGFVKKIQDIGKQCLVFKVPRQGQIDQIIERVIPVSYTHLIMWEEKIKDFGQKTEKEKKLNSGSLTMHMMRLNTL